MATNYKQQAQKEYDVTHNQKVQALKNQLAQNQQQLDQQKTGINANYDTQVSNQNLSNKKSKNNLSNTMLGRGLANSSIVTSGLAESDQINNRIVGQINTERTGALNDIEAQKALLAQNTNASISQMEADRLSAIEALARQLEDRDFEKNYKNNTLALQREQMLADQQYKNMSLAQQKELANAQIAWQREQAQNQLALQQQKAQKEAYNTFLNSYYGVRNSSYSNTEKNQLLKNLADEMTGYSTANGIDLSDLIKLSQRGYTTANGVNVISPYGSGITRSTK